MDSRATDNTALITILIVMIITVSSTVGYAATSSVGESSTTARTSSSASAVACTQPQVTAVSPITTNASATIVIKGCGFGNNPETVVNPYVQDGTVDTVESDVSPSMAIIDGNPAGSWAWEAGFAINSNTPDSIGIHLASWNDTTIVFGVGTGRERPVQPVRGRPHLHHRRGTELHRGDGALPAVPADLHRDIPDDRLGWTICGNPD